MKALSMLREASGLELDAPAAERAIRARMAKLKIDDEARYLASIDAREMQELIDLVVVPESWMFRDPLAFEAAVRLLKSRAGQVDRKLRILSIPCAGGEEPYSMAIALQEAGIPATAYSIDAFDLSAAALDRARSGIFTANAFRGGDLAYRERHFEQTGRLYQLKDSIREPVTFSHANVLTFDIATTQGYYDVIFCRNLLIYFNAANVARAAGNLLASLRDDGVLFAGYSEVPAFCNNGFEALRLPGAFALQKGSAKTIAPQRPGAARPPMRQAGAAQPPLRLRAAAAARPASRPGVAAALPPTPPPATSAVSVEELARVRAQADGGDLDAAAKVCEAILQRAPDCAEAYYILGLVADHKQRRGAADDYWRRCIYLQPDHYEALCHLALLADAGGDSRSAASLRQRAARVFERRARSEGNPA
jgi:chemotaxis protein methyltransferase WspC